MKRVLAFILMLALFAITPPIVLANAEEDVAEEKQEILFQGIPWDSDVNTVRKILIDKGFPIGEVMRNHSINFFEPGLRLYVSSSSGSPSCGVAVGAREGLKASPVTIAGYPIENSWATFVFDCVDEDINTNVEDAHFIFACVVFDTLNPQYVYEDLARKLSTLYGESESVIAKSLSTTRYSQTGETSINFCDYSVWYGANNTAVLLEYRYEIMNESSLRKDDSVRLIYGKTDGKEKVKALENLIEKKAEEEKQRQLEIERQNELEQMQQNQNNDISGL